MDDLISRKAAMDCCFKPQVRPNAEIFNALKMAISSEISALQSVPAVPLDKLCNTLSGLYEVLPCWECEKVLGEEYCQEKECGCGSIDHWKSYFEKKMEGLDAAD